MRLDLNELKILFVVILVQFFCILVLSANMCFAAELTLPTSDNAHLILQITDNTNVSAFNFTVVGLPVKNVENVGDTSKTVDYEGNKVIVYGLNDFAIQNGDLLDIEFEVPLPYGDYSISIIDLKGATGEALPAVITNGGDGTIAIRFSEEEVVAERDYILGRSDQGIDINNDGVADVVDLQIIINNRGE